ncbi:hypothetical protein A6C57_01025 [Fibrella sp. ES10-3-2-2]|nr:hypothetical protein A6C57_01025 [Fibrella sp. ES10-3-2-2]
MLATLETIALEEGLPFRYGKMPDENDAADDELASQWLFQEGYLNGTLRLDPDNAVTVTYTVSLWILLDSRLAYIPADRGPQLVALLQRLVRIYRKLGNHGSLGTASFIEGVNLLDRNVDGLRLNFSFTPTLPFTVC